MSPVFIKVLGIGAIVILVSLMVASLLLGCLQSPASISGQVKYEGIRTGKVLIDAVRTDSVNSETPGYRVGIVGAGSYSSDVSTGEYAVSAFVDTDYNGERDLGEPWGVFDADGDGQPDDVSVKGRLTGIDITLK